MVLNFLITRMCRRFKNQNFFLEYIVLIFSLAQFLRWVDQHDRYLELTINFLHQIILELTCCHPGELNSATFTAPFVRCNILLLAAMTVTDKSAPLAVELKGTDFHFFPRCTLQNFVVELRTLLYSNRAIQAISNNLLPTQTLCF